MSNIYQKRLYDRRKQNGLCIDCGKPLDRDGLRCISCRSKKSENERRNNNAIKKLAYVLFAERFQSAVVNHHARNAVQMNQYNAIIEEIKVKKHERDITKNTRNGRNLHISRT